jgi:prophage regulatory protein
MFVAVTGHIVMRVLSYSDLSDKGIKYTRQHIHRLVRQKKFPPPFKLNGSERGQNSWFEHVIDQHLEACERKAVVNAA